MSVLRAGALVFFYRSQDLQAFTTAGVVESVLVTSDAGELAAFLHKRTVYRGEDIRGICASGEALGFTFRHAPILSAPIPLSELLRERVLSGAPQSITTLNSSSLSWLIHRP